MPSRRSVGCTLLALSLLAACEGPVNEGRDAVERVPVEEPTRARSPVIGLVGTLSGDDSWRGQDAFEGAHLAVADINRGRGEDLPSYELVSRDDEGDGRLATQQVVDLAFDPQTVGIVYAGPLEGLLRAEDVLEAAGVPAVLAADSVDGLHPSIFQTTPSYRWQARRLVRYARRDRGYLRVGLLAEDSPAGRIATHALRRELRATGRALAATATLGDGDVGEALEVLRKANVEAVVIQGGPAAFTETLEEIRSLDAAYLGTPAARIASAPPALRRLRQRENYWHPQILAFAGALSSRVGLDPAPGTVVAESYGRGIGLLEIPSLKRFERAFLDWWGDGTNGTEARSYDAARILAWGGAHAGPDGDSVAALEALRGVRWAGLTVTFGPRDHVAGDLREVGLWTIPGPGAGVAATAGPPWAPLARSFADGAGTRIARRDWRALFRGPVRSRPRFTAMRGAVTAGPSDPLH